MSEINRAQTNTEARPLRFRAPRAGDIIKTGLLFLAGRASILGTYPFAAAMFAASFDKRIAYLGIIAALGGMISVHAGMYTIKYLSAMIIFCLFTAVVRTRTKVLSSIVCGASVMVCGFGVMLAVPAGIYDVMLLIVESILTALMYIIFDKADGILSKSGSRTHVSGEETVSFCIALGVYVTGLTGVRLPFGMDAAHIAACLLVMTVALHTNLAAAGSGALAIGLVCSLNDAAAVIMMGMYGLAGFFGNLLKVYGKYGAALGFMSGMVVTLLYTGDAYEIPLQATEVILAALIFVLTPNKLHSMAALFFAKSYHAEYINPDRTLKDYLTMRLDAAANAFAGLADTFTNVAERRMSEYRTDTTKIFETAAETVCDGCAMSRKCWRTDFNNTYKAMLTILSNMEKKGTCTIGCIPLSFRDRCARTDRLCTELTHSYRLLLRDKERAGDAAAARAIVAGQYREFAASIAAISADIQNGFSFLPDYETAAAEELDKAGIILYEISILEVGGAGLEIYLTVEIGADKDKIEQSLTRALERPIRFEGAAAGGLLKFVPAPKFAADFSGFKLGKDGTEVSGDTLLHFKTDDYKEYVIICDGMGSGRAACRESSMTAKMLAEFINAGITPARAVEIVNSSLMLRPDTDMFTTIDILALDLMTGTAEFIKAGSAESCVCRSRTIDTLLSRTSPAGIPGAAAEPMKRVIADGDVIVMMSDGVTEAGDTLKSRILKINPHTPNPARDIIMTALDKNGGAAADDMTAAVMIINEL